MLLAAEVRRVFLTSAQTSLKALVDGHILSPRRASTLRYQEASFYIPHRVQGGREGGVWTQDIFHVRSFASFHRPTLIFPSFVAILFADALQRMFRVTAESDLAKSNKGMVTDLRTDTSIAARKF